MNSIVGKFTRAAALAGGIALAPFAASAQQIIIIQPPQQVNLDETAACISFENKDRNGHEFEDTTHHQFDSVLKDYAEALESYSGWADTLERLNNSAGFEPEGVCVYNHGGDTGPIKIDQNAKTIDINLFDGTPWGPDLQSPEEAAANLDTMIHYTFYTLNTQTMTKNLVVPALDVETAAFLNTLANANAHAEAILSTVERGLDEGRLDDLAPILYDNSPIIPDEISELYINVLDSGEITAEHRAAFKAAVFSAFAQNDNIRMGIFQGTAQTMQAQAQQGVDISRLYSFTPTPEDMARVLEGRFGAEVANLQIDGASLAEAYQGYWADEASDPAAQLKQQFTAFRERVGNAIAQQAEAAEQAEQAEQEQQQLDGQTNPERNEAEQQEQLGGQAAPTPN